MFEAFERIDAHGILSKPIPAAFGVEGYFFRYERHFVVYWCRLSNGDIGIVTILHERMLTAWRDTMPEVGSTVPVFVPAFRTGFFDRDGRAVAA